MWGSVLEKPFVTSHIGVTVTFITLTDRSFILRDRWQIVAEDLIQFGARFPSPRI
jgi:hypothetical protein